MIVLLTRRDDLAADYLIQRLIARRVDYLRFDVDYFMKDVFLSSSLTNDGWEGRLTTPQGVADLSDVRAIWYRRSLSPPMEINGLSAKDRPFAQREASHFLQGVFASLDAKWLNRWDLVSLAERKLVQLPVARSLGFLVPSTLVSSDACDLQRFVQNESAVNKAISYGMHYSEAGAESVYTRDICSSNVGVDNARLCPTLVQQKVDKVADIRLTVVGTRMFAARLDASLEDGLDWRRPSTDVVYTRTPLPEGMQQRVSGLMRHFGLQYGALDFAVDGSGNWWFLEINPVGEFAWIEHRLGFPIRDTIIDWLLN